MSWLDNQWVIGLGTGLVTTLITLGIGKFFASKKENREFLRRVEIANNEILHALRPLIAEQKEPTKAMIRSLVNSTARNFLLEPKDLLSVGEIIDALVREIMVNSFLSSHQKIEFSQVVYSLREEAPAVAVSEKKYRVLNFAPEVLAMMAGLMAAAFSLFAKESELDSKISENAIVIVYAVITSIVAMVAGYYWKRSTTGRPSVDGQKIIQLLRARKNRDVGKGLTDE